MYNSLFVSLIVKTYGLIVCQYDKSILKKVIKFFGEKISYLSNGSRFKSIFKSQDYLIEKSLIYSLYNKFMESLNKTIDKLRALIRTSSKSSLVYKNIQSLFRTKTEVLRTFFVFMLSFGLGLLINNIIRGHYSGRSYLVAIIAIVASIIGISLRENYKQVLKESYLYRFIYSIFSIEEGNNSW